MAEAKRRPFDKGRRPPDGTGRAKDPSRDTPLSEKVWSALRAGKIPNRSPDLTSRGPGVGRRCPICVLPVTGDELVEIQFAHDDDTALDSHHLHLRCYAAWEFERRKADH